LVNKIKVVKTAWHWAAALFAPHTWTNPHPLLAHWFGPAKSDKQKSGGERKSGRGRQTSQNWKRARGWLQPSGRTI